jgi:hypothetical protein
MADLEGTLIMDAGTFTAGLPEVEVLVWSLTFTAAAVVPLPKVPTVFYLRWFVVVSSSATASASVNLTGETAAQLSTPTGFKPQILILCANSGSQVITRQKVNADTQLYVSAGVALNCLIGYSLQ